MPFFELKRELAKRVSDALQHSDIPASLILSEFSNPPGTQVGHVALPCFRLGKTLGKSPNQIAGLLSTALSNTSLSVTVSGPYANFKWNTAELYRQTLGRVFSEGDRYGTDTTGNGATIVLEYCSPNIAKRLFFHHIRSTLIGNVLGNIYNSLGYKTERVNFVGDWGAQFARLLASVEMWGDKTLLQTGDRIQAMNHLNDVYVRFHKEVDTDPSHLEKAASCLKRLEEKEPAATALWQLIRKISIEAMFTTLGRMGIGFDHIIGESDYIDSIEKTIDEVKAKAGAHLSEGAWIVDVEGISTPALIQKRDGTTLYLTRDIAAAVDRRQRFQFKKSLYIVGEQQRLHFQLLFGVLAKMGYDWAKDCEHLSFGTVLFGKEKMSSREGRVILLDDFLDEAKALALEQCTEKNPSLANKEEVAEMVGLAAVVFGELSTHRSRDLEFDWKTALAFDGETGPYVQYSLVRCHSLLEKAQGEITKAPADPGAYEFALEEEQLVLTLAKLESALHQATYENEPYHLTHYLVDLAKAFNRFYYRFPVLQATDPHQRRVRLDLVTATGKTLTNGMKILGIPCPKEM